MQWTRNRGRLRTWRKAVYPFVAILVTLMVGGVSYLLLRSLSAREEIGIYERVQTLMLVSHLRLLEEAIEAHGRGYLVTGNETLLERFRQTRAEFRTTLTVLDARVDGRAQRILRRIDELEAEHGNHLNEVLTAVQSGTPLVDVLDDFQLLIRPRRLTVERLFEELNQEALADFERARSEFLRRSQAAMIAQPLTLLLALTILVPVTIRSLKQPLVPKDRLAELEDDLERERIAKERLKSLIDNLGHAVVFEAEADPFRFTFVSERLQYVLGITPTAFLAEPEILYQFTLEEDRQIISDMFDRLFATREDQRCEHRMRTIDGQIRWIHTGVHLNAKIFGKDRILGIMLDITSTKIVQLEAQATKDRYEKALGGAGVGVWDYNLFTGALFFSDVQNRLYGYHPGVQLTREEVEQRIVEEDRARVRETFEEALRTGLPLDTTFRIERLDGVRWLKMEGMPQREADGRVERILGVTIDVADRHLAEARLREVLGELEEYKAALDYSSIVSTTDGRGIITNVNDKFCELSGYSREELIGGTYRRIRSGIHGPEVYAEIWATIGAGKVWKGDLCNRSKDGNFYWVRTYIVPFRDEQGRSRQYMAIQQDITDQVAAQQALQENEEKLRAAKEVAEAASHAKSGFLANMSHEIRTPLNAILGFAELMEEAGVDSAERADFLRRIRSNGDQLLHLIDDILDLTKIEAGRVAIEKVDTDLAALLREIVRNMEGSAAEKGLTLDLEFDSPLPKTVATDPLKFKQILVNLIGNGIKFTDEGRVRVRARFFEQQGQGILRIIVQDTGIGIEPDKQHRIFEPFMQADATTTRRYGGTGLGLALSRRIAEALGGELYLKSSRPGHGSTFAFDLPVGPAAALTFAWEAGEGEAARELPKRKMEEKGRLTGLRILLAEDSPDNALLMEWLLSKEGASVSRAENGLEAVAKAEDEHPDLILMDVQMPELDGLEATRRLRARGFSQPIIALTAHAMKEEIERSHLAGCDAHLTKPVKRDRLVETILAWSERRAG